MSKSVSTTAKRFASYIKLIPGIETMEEDDIVLKFDELEKAEGARRKAEAKTKEEEKEHLKTLTYEEREADKQRKKEEAAAKRKASKEDAKAKKLEAKAAKDAEKAIAKAEKLKKAAEREAKLREKLGDEKFEASKAKRLESLAKARETKKYKKVEPEEVEEGPDEEVCNHGQLEPDELDNESLDSDTEDTPPPVEPNTEKVKPPPAVEKPDKWLPPVETKPTTDKVKKTKKAKAKP